MQYNDTACRAQQTTKVKMVTIIHTTNTQCMLHIKAGVAGHKTHTKRLRDNGMMGQTVGPDSTVSN